MNLRRLLFFRDAPEVSWERYGQDCPYYGVLTSKEYLTLDTEKLAVFFASGDSYIRDILEWVNRTFQGALRYSRALDFGCGVGRLVIPLTQQFDEVVGVDVSPSMLAEAAKNCRDRGLSNVRFVLTRDISSERLGKFSLVHSYIVFQHIPPTEGARLMRKLVEMLEPGGIAVLHLTIGRRSVVRRAAQWLQRNFVPTAWAINVLRRKPWNTPVMQMISYSLNRVARVLQETGIEEFVVRVEEVEGTIGAFLLFRRPTT